MSKLLVTTAVEQTWGESQDLLFLGDWCKLYKQEKSWDKRVHQTVPYHRKDRVKFAHDHEYLIILHEKVLHAVSKKLNEYHNTRHSLRYWRIVIGPWLSIFVPTIFDRWESLKLVFLDYDFDEVFATQFTDFDFVKSDYQESTALIQSQKWNYQTYSDIILFQYKNKCVINKIDVVNEKSNINSNKPSRYLVKSMFRFIDNVMSKVQKNYKVVFVSSYFDIISIFRLSIKLKQLPRVYFNFHDHFLLKTKEINDRKVLIDFIVDSDFEKYLSINLFKNIPYSYIEGFQTLKNKALRCNLNGKIIFTANAHFSNDFFKIWSADQVCNKDSKLIISLHGGAIPSLMSSFSRHEDIVSDKKIVWHKSLNKKQIRLPPNKFLNKKIVTSKNKSGITVIGLDLGMYSYGHQSGPNSSLILEDFDQKVVFIENSSALFNGEVKIFPYSPSDWDIKSRYIDVFGEQIISPYKKFSDVINKSKIIVCTYPQTTFSEAMYSNTPVILLYVKEYWELRPEFNELLLTMKEAKIVFFDAILASKHISEIYSAPEEWWESDIVVSARNAFYDNCLRSSNDWLTEWGLFFKTELSK